MPNHTTSSTARVQKFRRKKPVACSRCHLHKIKCSGEQPCLKCRRAECPEECNYIARDRKVKVDESYLEQIIAEKERLEAQLQLSLSNRSSVAVDLNGENGAHPLDRSLCETTEDAGPSMPSTGADTVEAAVSGAAGSAESEDSPENSRQNPLIGDKAWFVPYDPSMPPIYIGEAACTAFATRLRRLLTGDPHEKHLPRTTYITDTELNAMAEEEEMQWPSITQARLLARVVLHQVSPVYHLLLRRSTLEQLETVYETHQFADPGIKSKFFALFALGEVYSARRDLLNKQKVPGTAYYVKAMKLVNFLPERPNITHVETLLLLSLFCYFLNRRHSGYILIGSAMRLGLIIGLNHSLSERHCSDPVEREHRVRIWWAIYVFDRMWGSKTGFPIQLADEDIHVGMPSELQDARAKDQFTDTAFLNASIELARLAGEIVEKVYIGKKQADSFLQRVQRMLLALQAWLNRLPLHIRLGPNGSGSAEKHVVSLHLQLNQCLILATRPILLLALIHYTKPNDSSHRQPDVQESKESKGPQTHDKTLSQTAITLSEGCICAARHSHMLITEEWVQGTLATFGYFYAQYLFAAALVLVLSSLLPFGTPSDFEKVESALEILQAMSKEGNLAATEFYDNLDLVLKRLNKTRPGKPLASREPTHESDQMALQSGHGHGHTDLNGTGFGRTDSGLQHTDTSTSHATNNYLQSSHAGDSMEPNTSTSTSTRTRTRIPSNSIFSPIDTASASYLTTGMALQDPSMQDFLALSNVELDAGMSNAFEMPFGDNGLLDLWPDMSFWTA